MLHNKELETQIENFKDMISHQENKLVSQSDSESQAQVELKQFQKMYGEQKEFLQEVQSMLMEKEAQLAFISAAKESDSPTK